ncbi:hypothetical protein [Chryseobacterium sp. Bi04]|uniref:hypothetical protein n=1 Tax=Chryseobacterium sp. Bi04 TaxID=2822345 RepID=UPI001D88A6A4|nr:hypothetical protein [Chryseobacterium sp. Bi04]CAH0295583.1 hypothetical protein SRABI04_04480 [Chryseobacterium sp. Bi04]
MYHNIYDFLDQYFPSIEGCILFGSYIEKKDKANDVDLLLISERFSFSSTESFTYKNLAFNIIKINFSEVLNIMSKQFKQGNFLSHAFKTGTIIKDENQELSYIKKYVLDNIPNASADVINFDLSEVRFKINDYMEPLRRGIGLTTENFLQAARVVSLFVDYFLLSNGIYLKTEKSKNKYFFQNFPTEAIELSQIIDTLKKSEKIKFINGVDSLISKYSILIKEKYSNNFILDDYTQEYLICFVEQTFKFNEISELIKRFKENNPNVNFFIYQVDEENQEKAGCYIVINNRDQNIDIDKKEWIIFFQKVFPDIDFIFPYNNIFCYPKIKFMGHNNELIVNEIMYSLINIIFTNASMSKEKIIFGIVIEFFAFSTLNIYDAYNYYLIKMDSKAKTSNFLNVNRQKIEDKFIKANQSIELPLIQRLSLSKEKLINFESLKNISQIVHLQILDRILSVFLSKDYEKFYYIHAIKLKLNEKIS